MQPKFSVIVPAFNEEAYLPRSLGAIRRAEATLGEPVEIIVGDNMSTDGTVRVAEEFDARVVQVEKKCISSVRNQAAATATGKFLVFTDADNEISENMFVELEKLLESGEYIGGGVINARYERRSLGLNLIQFIILSNLRICGVSMFMFYAPADVFQELGGFNEELLANEDMEFAMRLKRLGKTRGLKFCNLKSANIVLSARKFDEYGDWAILRHPIMFVKAFMNNPEVTYEIWYRPRR
ncbi:MAG: glycosyltransferase [Candidatus Hydrogenedentes bacterium]|nr:glycosyltransferase [Candidatus Hydrogenedentota bacterium]